MIPDEDIIAGLPANLRTRVYDGEPMFDGDVLIAVAPAELAAVSMLIAGRERGNVRTVDDNG